MDGLARLAEHIDGLDGKQAAFAKVVECSEPHLSLILSGKRGLSLELAARIERASGIPAASLARPREPAEARA
jgi:antitoxin component HigA of HigAB toxin-antitoxin module